jgi:hypothetical protein
MGPLLPSNVVIGPGKVKERGAIRPIGHVDPRRVVADTG